MLPLAELYAGCAERHQNKGLLLEYLARESDKLRDLAEKLANSAKSTDRIRMMEYLSASEGMRKMMEEISYGEA